MDMSEIFLLAGQSMANPGFLGCCEAIWLVENRPMLSDGCQCDFQTPTQVYFRRLMKPRTHKAYWWEMEKEPRVIALFLAAAIAKSEGK